MSDRIETLEIQGGRNSGLYLIQHTINEVGTKPTKVESPTNHLAVIDCSGSMSGDLPRIRGQLKKKLTTLLKKDDTLSIIWFSGRGQFGTLLEGEPVATLADLNEVNKKIDRWLIPIGLTGFKEPIEEVGKVVTRIRKNNKNPFALFFMSDGCDNQWKRADILKAVERAAGDLASSTFVEYGYYADRPMLTAMAEKAGGVLIFAEDFAHYEPMFEAAMQKRPLGGKRIEIAISGDPVGGIAWTMSDGEIVAYEASTGNVRVPEKTDTIYYLSPTPVGKVIETLASYSEKFAAGRLLCAIDPAFAALSLFAVRMKPEIVYPILRALGDIALIDQFSTCFGKQKYSEFMEAARLAAFDHERRWTKGRDPERVPADDAFTVLDLLRVLSEDDSTRLLLDHPNFNYSRISRARVDADENLSADESTQIEEIRMRMAGEKSAKKLKELQAEVHAILAKKRDALTFVADPAPDGYAIANLTYNEDRPNISMLVQKTGKVDLGCRPDHVKFKIPIQFKTKTWRNYAMVQDGLVNIGRLPAKISEQTFDTLLKAGVELTSAYEDFPEPVSIVDGKKMISVMINVKPLPIINRKMVKAVSAKTIIELEWELLKRRAAQKVYKHYFNEKFPTAKLKSFEDLYGADGALWLKEQGFTANGFSPRMVQAVSTDFIIGKELKIKLKGCSTLASVSAVRDKIAAKKKLNPCDTFMSEAISEVDAFLKKNPVNLHEKWLKGKMDAAVAETRGLIYQTAQIKFGILVGQVWFNEFSSLDVNQLTVKLDGQDVLGTCELREIEIKI